MNLYHLETDTLVTVMITPSGYFLVEVINHTGIVYKCLHDTITGAEEDARENYDALGEDL